MTAQVSISGDLAPFFRYFDRNRFKMLMNHRF